VNLWETKLDKEHNFVDECRQRNNILIFRIEECLQDSYFDTLKITEGILRMKLKFGIASWNIERFCRLGKERGGRPFLVRFILITKKLEVLNANGNLAGTKLRMEQHYSAKQRGSTQMTDALFEGGQTTGKHSIPLKRQIGDKQKIV
jgi:hypothetical protein